MTEHTPGPWITESVMGDDKLDVCLDYDVPGEGRPIMVGSVYAAHEGDGPITLRYANANARLMAAAPELYDALNDALDILGEVLPKDHERRAVLDRGNAVLLKVLGYPLRTP